MYRLARLLPAFCLLAATPARASDPVGVYALVSRVVFEPPGSSAANARNVQVHGVFAIATGKPGDGDVYLAPQKGYMYYACQSGQEQMCQLEWADLAKAAGAQDCAGYGNRYLYAQNGRVRPDGEAPAGADGYPTGFNGVQTTSMQQCPNLHAFVSSAPDLAMTTTTEPKLSGMSCRAARAAGRGGAALALALGLVIGVAALRGAQRRRDGGRRAG